VISHPFRQRRPSLRQKAPARWQTTTLRLRSGQASAPYRTATAAKQARRLRSQRAPGDWVLLDTLRKCEMACGQGCARPTAREPAPRLRSGQAEGLPYEVEAAGGQACAPSAPYRAGRRSVFICACPPQAGSSADDSPFSPRLFASSTFESPGPRSLGEGGSTLTRHGDRQRIPGMLEHAWFFKGGIEIAGAWSGRTGECIASPHLPFPPELALGSSPLRAKQGISGRFPSASICACPPQAGSSADDSRFPLDSRPPALLSSPLP